MPVNMKNVIADTFVSMAKQKPVDKITVKALIEACGVSRQTFYYHFQDIMEVIEWTLEQATQEMLERSLKSQSAREALIVLIDTSKANSVFIRKLLDSQKRAQIEMLFVQAARSYCQRLLQKRKGELPVNDLETEAALDFLSFGITGILFKYCGQNPIDSSKLADQICRLFPV